MEGFQNPHFFTFREALFPNVENQQIQAPPLAARARSLVGMNEFFNMGGQQQIHFNMIEQQQNNYQVINNNINRQEQIQNFRLPFRPNNFINEINMQYRDFGPEDYEMLMQLDRNIKKQGISKEKMEKQKQFRVKKYPKPTAYSIIECTESLWTFKMQKGDPLIKDKCSICLEAITYNQIARQLTCTHVFHKKCIDKWLKNNQTCPIDRNVL